MNCDHTIGVRVADDGGFVRQSEVADVAAGSRNHIRYCQKQWGKPEWSAEKLALSDLALIESNHQMFAFCPDCGAHL